MPYDKQQEHFTDYLIWLQAGLHSGDSYKKKPYNETCNAYLKEVFRFYRFSGQQDESIKQLKVLSDMRIIVHNSVGVKRTLYRNTFHGYLQEKGHIGKTIEQDKIVILLKACANCRDQILLLLLAETGFRIGELLGVRYATDIDYERHLLYVNFREDNENGARAKNAEYRKAKISDATFEILQFYIEEYKDLIFQQEYLIINISGDYAGKPMQDSGVYALMERLQKKTGIKVTPHMLRHYFANARRKAGWKLELISQALGHRNIETTMRYLNISDMKKILRYSQKDEEYLEQDRDVWELDKFEFPLRSNPIKNVKTINFKGISQITIRKEVKTVVFMHLKYMAIGSITAEMVATKRFCRYLALRYPKIKSLLDLTRDIMENYENRNYKVESRKSKAKIRVRFFANTTGRCE